VREHLFAIDLKTFAELDGRLLNQLFQMSLALDQRQFSQILMTVEIKQIESDHDEPVGLAAQLVLQHGEIRGAVCCRHHHLAVDYRGAGIDQIGVVTKLAEAPGPVITPPGEYLDGVVMDVELDAIAVELDLVDPAIAARHSVDRTRQRRLDESGEGRLHANRRRLLALKRHAANSTPLKPIQIVKVESFRPGKTGTPPHHDASPWATGGIRAKAGPGACGRRTGLRGAL
jgi:hypothetical protein